MTKFLNISTDATLGGNAPSDELAVSQKAIKTYVDNHSGGGGLPDQTGHAGEFLTTDGTDASWSGAIGYHPDLFDWKWADHQVNDVQWLRADTFSWQDGTVYSNAYDHLADDISGKTLQTETVGGTTISFYLADDGHKICPAAQESNVTAIYTATGVAWYYILDTVNQRFKLPRTKFGATGLRDTVGNYVSESLPNVSGNCSGSSTNASDYSGPFVKGADFGSVAGGGWSNGARATFNLSVANSTYQDNAPVQQRATQQYLYFYVGSFTQTALENTAGLNAGLFNGKADLNLLNTTNNVDFVIDRQEPNAGNNYTWYRKYRSGWVEQGGVKNHSAGTIDITLVIPMADTDYSVLGSFGAGYGASNNNNFVLVPYSSTVIRLTDNNSGSMYWRVSGKAA